MAIATKEGSTAYIPKVTADKNRYSMTSAMVEDRSYGASQFPMMGQ